METNQKWSYSINDDERYNGEICESRERAIELGINQAINNEETLGTLFIGTVNEFAPTDFADTIIDMLCNQACNEAGEFADDYLLNVEKDHMDELNDGLQAAFQVWESNHPEYKPTFYTVSNVEKFDIEELLKNKQPQISE